MSSPSPDAGPMASALPTTAQPSAEQPTPEQPTSAPPPSSTDTARAPSPTQDTGKRSSARRGAEQPTAAPPEAERPATARSGAHQAIARGDRRRARTRQKLITAARGFLQSPGYAERSIAEITEAADIGLGSFYNHFESKQELFAAAVHEVLDEHGAMLDATSPSDEPDPAQLVAVAIRSTARLVLTNPEMAQILATQGMSILDCDEGLMPRARRVLASGVRSGRFIDADPELLLAPIIGALLAGLHLWMRDPHAIDEQWCDDLAERLLVLCGVPATEAHPLAHSPDFGT